MPTGRLLKESLKCRVLLNSRLPSSKQSTSLDISDRDVLNLLIHDLLAALPSRTRRSRTVSRCKLIQTAASRQTEKCGIVLPPFLHPAGAHCSCGSSLFRGAASPKAGETVSCGVQDGGTLFDLPCEMTGGCWLRSFRILGSSSAGRRGSPNPRKGKASTWRYITEY
jgi:hypothetical protein